MTIPRNRVQKALEGAKSVPGIETEFYEMAGKKFHHCTGCYNCLRIGADRLTSQAVNKL